MWRKPCSDESHPNGERLAVMRRPAANGLSERSTNVLRGKTWSGVLSVGLLLAGAGWASADDPGMGMHGDCHCDGGMMRHRDEGHRGRGMHAGWMDGGGMHGGFSLNLTDQQRTKIRDIIQSNRDQMRNAMQNVMSKREALQKQVHSDKPDEGAIRSAANDLAKVIGDAAVQRSKIRSQIRGVLTDDQRKKIDELRDVHQEMVNRWLDRWVLKQAESEKGGEHRGGGPGGPEHHEGMH
jgi:Spy/CpxP family protein refolding chaperone